jgi:hypothetical protein
VRISSRLRRLGLCLMCTMALVVADLTINESESLAGPAPGLCQMNSSRGTIPANFAIEACSDGQYVYLHNNLTVALTVKVHGNVGPAKRSESDYGLAADATRLNSNDPRILLPGDTLRIEIGPRAALFRVYDSRSAGFYALALTLQTFVPGSGPAVIDSFTSLVSELNADFGQYKGCLAGKNWLEQIGCDALFTRNVNFAIARVAVSAAATGALSAILAEATFSKWLVAQVPNVEAVLGSATIFMAGAARVVPTTTATVPTTPTTSPPATTSPTAPSFATGSSFNDDCVIAWPTAPFYTNNSIEMTMSCGHVPEGQFLFTNVIYDSTSLKPTPNTGTMHVAGQVVGVARSSYGYSELEVQASSVTILGNSG